MKNWEAMTPRERDAEIAQTFFGITPHRCGEMDVFTIDRVWLEEGDYSYYVEGEGHYRIDEYTTDYNAVSLVESAIGRRELKCTYVTELLQLCGHYTMRGDFNEYWDLVRAKPEQRCLAALRATAQ